MSHGETACFCRRILFLAYNGMLTPYLLASRKLNVVYLGWCCCCVIRSRTETHTSDKDSRFGTGTMADRVLVVEDQRALLESLACALREEGYEVTTASCVTDARPLAMDSMVDAMLLDMMLPDGDGLELLRELRHDGFHKPVLVLTARQRVEDRVTALNAGADDYVVKPFSFDELLARLRAILRRTSGSDCDRLTVGDLSLDLVTRRVLRCGHDCKLTQREFELLLYLMQRSPETVDREGIAREVWRESNASWSNVIEVQINHLRRKIERKDWPCLLHTQRGKGYWLGVRR